MSQEIIQNLSQVGIGGVIAWIIIKEVLAFFKAIKTKGEVKEVQIKWPPQSIERFQKMADQTAGLYRMHDVTDSEGRYVWHTGNLSKAVDQLTCALDRYGNLLERLLMSLERIEKDSERHDKKMDRLLDMINS